MTKEGKEIAKIIREKCKDCPYLNSHKVSCEDCNAKSLCEAGYHKTVWHKVTDGDLPKKAGQYLCYVYWQDYATYSVEYFVNDFNVINGSVFAWCELPEYKGE